MNLSFQRQVMIFFGILVSLLLNFSLALETREVRTQFGGDAGIDCAHRTNEFSFKFYNVLRKIKGNENMVFSAFSFRTIMATLLGGANGITAAEIRNGMLFSENDSATFEGFHSMLLNAELIGTKPKQNVEDSAHPATLQQANRIFIKNGFPINETFQETAKNFFQSPISQINFKNSKKAVTEINNWVSEKTNRRIQNLLANDAVNHLTRMVVVNTLYFQGPWNNMFYTSMTQRRPFHVNQDTQVSVDTMHIEDYFSVSKLKEIDARGIKLPYQGNRFELVILLPNQRFGLEEMEERLAGIKFSTLHNQLTKSRVKNILLSLPKFRIQSSHELIDSMKELGMKTLFDENEADFSGIISPEYEQLFVSKIVQKAFLSVDEKGSEAGAATFAAAFIPYSSVPDVEEAIEVNHPFLGYIYDTLSQGILFVFRKTRF